MNSIIIIVITMCVCVCVLIFVSGNFMCIDTLLFVCASCIFYFSDVHMKYREYTIEIISIWILMMMTISDPDAHFGLSIFAKVKCIYFMPYAHICHQ